MGKNKPNAYSIFVRDEYNRMKRAGGDPAYPSLFSSLSSKWQSLPEEARQRYKDRATNGGGPPPRPQPPPQPTISQHPEPQPSTSSGSIGFSFAQAPQGDTYVKMDPFESGSSDVKPELVDVKSKVKEERGVKRELELDTFGERQQDQPRQKKQNLGFSVPNWKNIKNSTQPEADRYFDYELSKLRTTCESIVTTRERRLMEIPLYTMSCNVLCKYKKDGKEIKYIPIEFGIHAYSIEKGPLGKPYHVIIDAGPPPKNYWGDTYDHMTNTHKILVTQSGQYPSEARKDYRAIYKEMMKYVKPGEKTLLVADSRDIEQVKLSIDWLYEQASISEGGLPKPSSWTILPLVDFVTAAYNFVYCRMLHYPLPKFTLHYYLKVRLETSIWDYEVAYMCDYHKKNDNQTKWCARNCAIRVIKALEMTLEEIYENYKLAVNPPTRAQASTTAEAQPTQQQAPPHSSSSSAPTSSGSQQQGSTPTRLHAHQVQQPLNMPEENEPPPLFEQLARYEELRRQQEQARQQAPPPPPETFEDWHRPLPSQTQQETTTTVDENGPILAIEQPPPADRLNSLDPRLRRRADAQV